MIVQLLGNLPLYAPQAITDVLFIDKFSLPAFSSVLSVYWRC